MSDKTESTMQWKLDIAQFKANIQDAKHQISLANAEFKTATASMEKWANNITGVESKLKQLDKVEQNQKTILEELSLQYLTVSKELGENSTQAEKLKIQIENQKAAIAKTEAEIKKYNERLETLQKENEKAESASGKLNAKIAEQQKELDELKDAYKNATLEYGENSKEARDLASQISSLSGELATNKSKLDAAEKSADELDQSMTEAGKTAESVSNGGFTVMKGALANLVSQGINLAVQGFKNLAKEARAAYEDFDSGADAAIKATGATGEAAAAIEKSYANVTKNVTGDLTDIGEALGEVSTRFGFSGSALEDATEQFIKFADVTGTDAKTAVQLVSRAMENAGIDSSEYASVLDNLAVAAQSSGVDINTLAGHLTQYGAVMRQMGFDTEEAIAAFAQWEKAGVNTETAFTGMRTAVAKWTDAGLDAREELDKLIAEIKEAPDATEATALALEAFGNRAGTELADAIYTGRFEYQQYIDLLENSAGTVKNTYEETRDGFDDVRLAIQGVKTDVGAYVGELAKRYRPQIQDFSKKVVKAIKDILDKGIEVAKWVKENKGPILATLKAVATAFVTYKAVQTITNVINAFKAMSVALKAAETAQAGLNTTMSMNPYGLIIAAVAALAVATISLAKSNIEAAREAHSLTAEQRAQLDEINKLNDAYRSMKSARDDAYSNTNAEFDYIAQLKDEYNSYVGANGQVQAGYETRAAFIKNQLAEAMGIELEDLEKLIDANGRLGESIDNVLLKKRAEAYLASSEAGYYEAIDNQEQAEINLAAAADLVEQRLADQASAVDALNKVYATYFELTQTPGADAGGYLQRHEAAARAAVEASNAALHEAQTALSDAQATVDGYAASIENYEGTLAATLSGDVDAISDAVFRMQHSFVSAEAGSRAALVQQRLDAKAHLASLQDLVDRGVANVSQEAIDGARRMVEMSEAELEKFDAKQIAEIGMQEYVDAVNDSAPSAAVAADNVVHAIEQRMGMLDAESIGINFTDGLVKGITNEAAMNRLLDGVAIVGRAAINKLETTLEVRSPSRATRRVGVYFGEGFREGIQSMISKVAGVSERMANASLDKLKVNVNRANSGMSGVRLNSRGAATGQNIVFNQYNNSPKALDRLTIYRETNSMLFGAKVRLNNV